ncbi:hypothetical protein [Salinarimonas rosea]|uniref:phage tail tube protein n=1 Tax=Salinarimonas rosea TaxID=552063 RepID=UPI00041A1946|nr:hypothetical protein [Salinarimonas rosea]
MSTAYRALDSGLYNLNNAEVIGRIIAPGNQKWFQFGDCDAAGLNITVDRLSRTAKNGVVRSIGKEIVRSVDGEFTMTAMQFRRETRAAQMLAEIAYLTQAASVAATYAIAAGQLEVGMIYYVGAFDISNVAVAAGAGATALVEGTHFVVVDPADGGVQIIGLPGGITEADEAEITFDAAAIDVTAKRPRLQLLTKPSVSMEIKVRGTAPEGFKATLHLLQVDLAPSGAIEFLSDEFASAAFSGRPQRTANGVGTWTEHG